MRVFVSLKFENVLSETIRLILTTFGSEIVADLDNAEVVFTDSIEMAMRALQDDDIVHVGIFSVPGYEEKRLRIASNSLKKTYGGRIELYHAIERDENDKNLMSFLALKGGKNEDSGSG